MESLVKQKAIIQKWSEVANQSHIVINRQPRIPVVVLFFSPIIHLFSISHLLSVLYCLRVIRSRIWSTEIGDAEGSLSQCILLTFSQKSNRTHLHAHMSLANIWAMSITNLNASGEKTDYNGISSNIPLK